MMPLQTYARWLLPASLLVNAFLIGTMVGHLGHPPFGPHPPGPPPELERRMGEGLDDEDAEIVRKAFDGVSDRLAQSRARLVEAHKQVRSALEADPYDPGALKAALDAIHVARDGDDEAMNTAFFEAVGKVSPEGRRKLAAHNPPREPPRGPPPGPPPGMFDGGPPPAPPDGR
jgi:uncharacterized membrane protein